MKRIKLPALLLCIALVVSAVSGCSKPSGAVDPGDPNEGRGDLITEEPQPAEVQGENQPEEKPEEQETSAGGYEALYLDKVKELSSEGLADSFALYHINDDDIPELIAADSNGSFDRDNAFIFSVFDGKVVQLASGICGVDGTSISFSEKKNLIRETYGMTGATETFSEIKDSALSEVFKAEMINTLQRDADDNEIFSYSVNGKETDEAAYYKEIAGFVADYDPMMRIDFDGLKTITYKSGDGSGYFEETETEAYQSLEEITGLLQ